MHEFLDSDLGCFSVRGATVIGGVESSVHARTKGRNADFALLGVDPSEAFNPMLNVINTESTLHDDSNIGSRLLVSLALPCDHHTMHHSKDITEEFVEIFSHSLAMK